LLGGRDELYPVFVEGFPKVIEVVKTAGKAVDSIGHHHVYLPALHHFEELLHPWPVETLCRIPGVFNHLLLLPSLALLDVDVASTDVPLTFH
jgi:hypothetical protein